MSAVIYLILCWCVYFSLLDKGTSLTIFWWWGQVGRADVDSGLRRPEGLARVGAHIHSPRLRIARFLPWKRREETSDIETHIHKLLEQKQHFLHNNRFIIYLILSLFILKRLKQSSICLCFSKTETFTVADQISTYFYLPTYFVLIF